MKAINYYNEAVLNADHVSLKLDLSELYLKLKQYTNAEQTLVSEIETLTRLVFGLRAFHWRVLISKKITIAVRTKT